MQYYDKMIVGERIKQIRKLRNMTQSNLAERLDYANERQLQRIENGETGCSVDKLMEIAQVLKTSTDYLLFGMEKGTTGMVEDVFRGKGDTEKMYLLKILKVAADNLDMLI